jgi:TRAP-type mannitol/chloroaromatic compound transport system permease small subunit
VNLIIRWIEGLSSWTGRAIAWFSGALVLLIVYDVGMRYLFNQSAVWMQELEWHLFAALILIGMAYTLQADAHVRVDVVYARLSPKGKAWVNLLGTVLFLIPFCLLVIDRSWGFAYNSYAMGERSADPGGLPMRYLIKLAVPFGFSLLLLQGVAEGLKGVKQLAGKGGA